MQSRKHLSTTGLLKIAQHIFENTKAPTDKWKTQKSYNPQRLFNVRLSTFWP